MIDVQEIAIAAKAGDRIPPQSTDGRHVLVVDYPRVSVYDTLRPIPSVMVAHSSMRADFEASLEEFVRDYLEGESA